MKYTSCGIIFAVRLNRVNDFELHIEVNMDLQSDQTEFLKSVSEFTLKFNSIALAGKTESLKHCFWSFEEIIKSESMKEEWEVPENFIPFYGNWHDLFCLNWDNNRIVHLNDT